MLHFSAYLVQCALLGTVSTTATATTITTGTCIYIWPFSVFKKFRHSLSATMHAKGGRRSCASFHLTSTPERHLQPKYGLLHAAQAGCLRCVKHWENYGVDLRSASDTDNTTSPQLLRTDRLYQAVCHGVYYTTELIRTALTYC